jgi:hypothetical protein
MTAHGPENATHRHGTTTAHERAPGRDDDRYPDGKSTGARIG